MAFASLLLVFDNQNVECFALVKVFCAKHRSHSTAGGLHCSARNESSERLQDSLMLACVEINEQ